MEKELMTVKELSEYLRVSQRIVYKMIDEEKLPYMKPHGKFLFRKSSIDNYLETLEQTKTP